MPGASSGSSPGGSSRRSTTATTPTSRSAKSGARPSPSCSGASGASSSCWWRALLSLDIFFDIGPLLAGAGIIGLAISFGAQSLVKDIISGFFILVENQFAVGDVIETAGKSGTVERMTLRVVMLRDLRGVLHIIPNGQMTVVSNQTRGWARAVVEVGVAYEVDVDRALAVFRDEAAAFGKDPGLAAPARRRARRSWASRASPTAP